MKKNSVSPAPRGKSKSLSKSASIALGNYLFDKYPNKIPIAALTAASKYYGRGRPLKKEDRIIKRLAGSGNDISTSTLIDLISDPEVHERGKILSDEAVRRVYQNFANPEGKLSFEYIMKMGESLGITITAPVAKHIVKKYGKKDHLSLDDCLRVNSRRSSKLLPKPPSVQKRG